MEAASASGFIPPVVSVIVLNWNNRDDIPACLDSIHHQTYQPMETIVVDNGSTDGSLSSLKRRKDIILIINEENNGFAAANNQGIRRARGAWVLLVNSDARLDPDCVENLMQRVLEEETIGSAAPKIYRGEGKTLDSTGVLLQKKIFSPCDRGELQTDTGQFDEPESESIFGPTGAVALYRREALAEARLNGEFFDEDFFAYYEDVDLAWRLQLLGWNSVFVPQAVARHDRKGPGVKSSRLQMQAYANRYFCYVKNEILKGSGHYLLTAVPYECGRYFYLVLRRPYMLGAMLVFLRFLPRMLRKRRLISARRKLLTENLKQLSS